jgi:hypothetical protein
MALSVARPAASEKRIDTSRYSSRIMLVGVVRLDQNG